MIDIVAAKRNLLPADELGGEALTPERRQLLNDFLVSDARKIALTSEGRRNEM